MKRAERFMTQSRMTKIIGVPFNELMDMSIKRGLVTFQKVGVLRYQVGE
ncbi:MAG: hypothetical protein WCY58_02885 [Mariniphaga sp.]|nr:hypothetical protein [Mariniphaga sp.]MDD4225525.1 hypothetical protein [Mariniphaga sp.]